MLVLSRRKMERIMCEEIGVTITVLESHSGRVRLGIEAPKPLKFLREEVLEAEKRLAKSTQPVQKVA